MILDPIYALGRILDPISPPCILDFSSVDMPQCQYQPAYIIMSISHPWPRATGKYAARGPHYVALGPPDAALGPRAPLYGPLAASVTLLQLSQ